MPKEWFNKHDYAEEKVNALDYQLKKWSWVDGFLEVSKQVNYVNNVHHDYPDSNVIKFSILDF